MDGYKIGEVARMFGLSNDTLRYYESKGLITPRRSEESGYRYYDVWDMNFLLDSMWYRSYGFPLAEVEQMVNTDDLTQFAARCRPQEMRLLQTINEYQRKLKQLVLFRQKLNQIPQQLGKFRLEKSPAMLWQCQRTGSQPVKGPGAHVVRQWSELMPLVEHTFVLSEEGVSNGDFQEYSWGFSMSPEKLDLFHLDAPETAEYIPEFQSMYTVFSAGGQGTFLSSLHQQVLDPLLAQGHTITHPPVGHLLVRVHEDGSIRRFFETWVPIGD